MPPTRSTLVSPEALAELDPERRGLSTRIKKLVLAELGRERPLLRRTDAKLPGDRRVPLALSAKEVERIEALRGTRGVSKTESGALILARLLMTALSGEEAEANPAVPPAAKPCLEIDVASALNGLPYSLREEQVEFATYLQACAENERVGLLEASTGVGKGLVMAGAAYAVASAGGRALVCAPTHAINRQLLSDLQLIIKTHGPTLVETVYGRREFVCDEKLAEVLDSEDELEDRDAAIRWLAFQREKYSRGARRDLYRAHALQDAAPRFPIKSVLLDTGSSGASNDVYEVQFDRAKAARIVVATAAMVAQDLIAARQEARDLVGYGGGNAMEENTRYVDSLGRAFPRLGAFDFALFDEAHQLDQIVANARAAEISLWSVLREMRALPSFRGRTGALKAVEQGYRAMVSLHDQVGSSGRLVGLTSDSQVGALRSIAEGIATALASKSVKAQRPDLVEALRRHHNVLERRVLSQKQHEAVSTSWTPVRRFPILTAGPRSVFPEMDFLWRMFPAAACCSATLYAVTARGTSSCAFVAGRLGIPVERRFECAPLIPDWLCSPVTLHRPRASEDEAPHPWSSPTGDARLSDEANVEYAKAVGDALLAVADTAVGGTLVLCTSYRMVDDLAAHCGDALGDRLVVSRRDAFREVHTRFCEMVARGERAVWLAVGSAWTGMNYYLEDPPPAASDNLVTDLVIPKMPFGMFSTSTSLARRQQMVDNAEDDRVGLGRLHADLKAEAAILLKQGFGRLVRRPGLPENRRIFLLDPRSATGYGSGGAFLGLLSRYERVKEITPESPLGEEPSGPKDDDDREVLFSFSHR